MKIATSYMHENEKTFVMATWIASASAQLTFVSLECANPTAH